jgi:hypothetical protein
MKTSWPDFKMPLQICPVCDLKMDTATAVRHDSSPQPGALTVCIGCGSFLKFGETLELELLPAEEFRELPNGVQAELHGVRNALTAVTNPRRTPYVGFSNETLQGLPPLNGGDLIDCPRCRGQHAVEEQPPLLVYACSGTGYIAGVDGRNVMGVKPDVKGEI